MANKTAVAPIILITGDEPLLLREALDHCRQKALHAGFSERNRIDVDTGFHWYSLKEELQLRDLFSDKSLVELHNPNAKFDDAGKTFLVDYAKDPNPEKVLLIITSKLTAAQKKTSWYKAIEKVGEIITIWPLKPQELPRFIQQRLQQAGLNANPNSIQMLAELTEGNLLATTQAIEKLRLLFPAQKITEKEMALAIADSARFNVFDLINYVLAGDAARVARIIAGLRDDGTEAIFVLWALARELRILVDYSLQLNSGKPMAQILQHEWAQRKSLLQQTLKRQSLKQWQKYLSYASDIDAMIKGIKIGHAWNALLELGLAMAGKPILTLEKSA